MAPPFFLTSLEQIRHVRSPFFFLLFLSPFSFSFSFFFCLERGPWPVGNGKFLSHENLREVRLPTPVILKVVNTLLDEGVDLVESGSPGLSVTSVVSQLPVSFSTISFTDPYWRRGLELDVGDVLLLSLDPD